jgi:hypothetical protein
MEKLTELLDNEFMKDEPDVKNDKIWVISIFLLLSIIMIWGQFYNARNLPYDENFGSIYLGLFLSLLIFIALIVALFKRRKWVMYNIFTVSLYTVTSNPILMVFVAYNYESLFGTYLDVG